jgi:hypothetical protein
MPAKTTIGLSALLLLFAAAGSCLAQDAVSARQQPSLACGGDTAEHTGCLVYRAPGDADRPSAFGVGAAAIEPPGASEASLTDCGFVCIFARSTDTSPDLTRLARGGGPSQH